MSDRQYEVAGIFHAVTDAPPERRAALLAELCGGNAELRGLVERLLAHDQEGMPGFLRPPTRTTETLAAPSRTAPADLRIGPYQVLEVLAEGGMGTVYIARQSQPVERDVALKVIRAGMDSRHVIARFEAERQALALMDHPNIAKVLDAGATDQGQPYFVMELIKGIPITDYCDRRRLTTRERLELFRPVCEAVQHAHQKAVIHRDLKPSNVLVAEVDGRPLPKVIDFGVAKATARRLTERTMFTEQGVMIGTLEYMSPEQANLTSEDVDTRTDVYSLGVILYELLVGALPFDAKDARGGYEGVRRRILEEEPRRPSTRITAGDARSTACAQGRGTDVATLRRQLKGDLDWIVMKALEKDRARRYASPMELAADLTRHLGDEPVEARSPTTMYRVRKFVRRHRLGVGAAAVVTVALVTAVVGTTTGLVRARRAEAKARAEQARSEKAAAFLAGTLSGIQLAPMGQTLGATLRERIAAQGRGAGSHAPGSGPRASDVLFEGVNLIDVSRSLVDDEILGKAVERIEKELKEEPALAADLYHAISKAYDNLDLPQHSLECAERAVQLSERARVRDDMTTNDMRLWLGHLYESSGRVRDGERVSLEAIESARRTRGADAKETLIASSALAQRYSGEGRADQAEPLLRKTLETMRRVLGADDPATIQTAGNLGYALLVQGRFAEAETLFRDTIERSSRVLGAGHIDTFMAKLNLAGVMYLSGRLEEAERMGLDLLNSSQRAWGENSYQTQFIKLKLGGLYMKQGRYDKAEGLLRESARRAPLVMGEQHPLALEAKAALAEFDSLRSVRRQRESGK